MGAENESERAQTGLQNGHSRIATVPISASNCGSFANYKCPNEKIGGLSRCSETGSLLWLEIFCGCSFVDIIRHNPASCGVTFLLFCWLGPYVYHRSLVQCRLLRLTCHAHASSKLECMNLQTVTGHCQTDRRALSSLARGRAFCATSVEDRDRTVKSVSSFLIACYSFIVLQTSWIADYFTMIFFLPMM